MEIIKEFIDLFLNLDVHLAGIITDYGTWTYAILFLIIFCETGLVVTPILPGDSLLFAAGSLAAITILDPHVIVVLLIVAAILGDMVNYWAGNFFGSAIFKEDARFLKKAYLDRTYDFYERFGGKTIVIARFVPIVRTFAPFVAGMGRMRYHRFFFFNVSGAILWVVLFVYGGYWFGNIPIVQKNFTLVILAIIGLSVLPMIIEFFRHRKAAVVPQRMD